MKAPHLPASLPRRAALMAHALRPEDQAWLLAALPPERRVVLQGLLDELRELGIPSDPELLDALAPQTLPAPRPTGVAALEALSPRQVRALAQLLQREGASVAARLLACRPWPWRAALLAAMDGEFVDRVRRAGTDRLPAAFEAALCNALLRQLEAVPPARFGLPGRALWQRASKALRPFGRRA